MTAKTIQSVAVLGAGTMGQGIARTCASAGFKTLLYDIRDELVERGITNIKHGLSKDVEKGKLTKEKSTEIENNIKGCATIKEVEADLIIEAVIEKMEIKQNLLREVYHANNGMAILATNTSSLSVTQIASALPDPTACLGLHFFNPASVMNLVEVVSGIATKPEYLKAAVVFVKKIEKIPVFVKDSPGFIVNRVARLYYVESLKLLEEHVSSVEGIDKLLRSAGFKMGPFELMDLIGVDTNFYVTSSLYDSFHGEAKFRPSWMQEQKVNAGHLGRKTKKGFYDYE
jgi:3-hydroxybutyryl-CoA dehydrogenase